MADAHKNFAYANVTNAVGTGGSTVTVTPGKGALFPAAPFNCTIWPVGSQPLSTNAEIVRVIVVNGDTFTLATSPRAQEGSTTRTIVIGDQIAATITAKSFTDSEAKPSMRLFNRANFI